MEIEMNLEHLLYFYGLSIDVSIYENTLFKLENNCNCTYYT